jgi:hypothetical protein
VGPVGAFLSGLAPVVPHHDGMGGYSDDGRGAGGDAPAPGGLAAGEGQSRPFPDVANGDTKHHPGGGRG